MSKKEIWKYISWNKQNTSQIATINGKKKVMFCSTKKCTAKCMCQAASGINFNMMHRSTALYVCTPGQWIEWCGLIIYPSRGLNLILLDFFLYVYTRNTTYAKKVDSLEDLWGWIIMRIATVVVALLIRACILQKYYLNLCRVAKTAHRQLYWFVIMFPTLSVNIFFIHTKTHTALQLIHMSTLTCCSIHFTYTQCPLHK